MPTSANTPGAGMVLARGRFDEVKIEALMREHGAHVEDYKGKRLIVADVDIATGRPDDDADALRMRGSFALAFLEPGLVALGSTTLIQSRDRPAQGRQQSADRSRKRHRQRRADEPGALARHAQRVGGRPLRRAAHRRRSCPTSVAQPDSRDHLVLGRAATSTAASAARSAPRRATTRRPTTCATSCAASWRWRSCRSGAKPELQAMMQSLELGGTGKTVVALVRRAGRGVRRDRRRREQRQAGQALTSAHAQT